jgi:hypothetical protein
VIPDETSFASTSCKGKLLVATPPLSDPNFDRTVIYMLEHTLDGAVGVVLNRPLHETRRHPNSTPGRICSVGRAPCSAAARSTKEH